MSSSPNRSSQADTWCRLMVEAAPSAMLLVDRDRTIAFVNPGTELLFGYRRDELIGQVVEMLIPGGLQQGHAGHVLTFRRDGKGRSPSARHELCGRRKDGTEVPIEVGLNAIETPDGLFTMASVVDITRLQPGEERVRRPIEAAPDASRVGGKTSGIALDSIERQQAETALQTERDRAQRYLDAAEVMLLALDLDGRITLVNRYGCSVLGWKLDELVGRDWIDTCLPSPIRDCLRRKFHDLIGGDLSIVEHRILTRSGQERLIEWRNTLLRDDAGHVVGTLNCGSDVTERKRAEEGARHRAQLSDLNAAIGLSWGEAVSIGSALQRCASALVTHLGVASAQIWILDQRASALDLQASAGPRAEVTTPGEKIALGQFDVGRIARDGVPHVTHTAVGDPKGDDQEWMRRERIVAFAGYPLIVDGRVIGVMALFARLTLADEVIAVLPSLADHIALGVARQRSAQAARTGEERMRFALEAAGVGIWDMDYTTGVLRWSEILETQYGLEPGTFAGTFESFVERVHPDDRESLLETVGKAMKTGKDFSIQNRSIWPDQAVHWLSGAGRVYLGGRGEPLRGVGISLDVTARRTLEEQYQQAQKMEAVGRLAGGVAHDFNNLLTVILGYCELLLADFDPDDPRRADLVEVQKAGARAGGLTRQLLAFSRKQIIEPTLLELDAVVADMRSMLERLIGEDVKVVVVHAPERTLMKADRGQVEQILMNLAVNARDAMPGGGTLTIGTANVQLDEHYAGTHIGSVPGSYVVLTVTDTGTGMTPQVQARLFEPFFTTKELGKGTGLGLATVYGIATQGGGSVSVESEVGRGTSFNVYFPRVEAVEAVVEAPLPVARPRAGTQTVLVVEDEEGVRQLAKRLLERQGYVVLVAANADEALQLFEQQPSIDVLLTDVVMPDASGPELTSQLRERGPAPKVIYMSGYTEDSIVHRGVINPGIAFLHKPFNSDTLGQKVREVLGD
jgi:two-component system cell cycle sensor histidine kinase/response regulator CckA